MLLDDGEQGSKRHSRGKTGVARPKKEKGKKGVV